MAPESMSGLPAAVLAVWILCATGWGAVLLGLLRGMRGPARGPALFAHCATPAASILLFAHIGFGSLFGAIALAAEWWALLLVTGTRPERLLTTGGLRRLAFWAALAAAGAVWAGKTVLH